jgi:hypothetical protein
MVVVGIVALVGTWLGVVFINPILQSLWQAGGGSEAGIAGGSLMPAVLFLGSIAIGAAIVMAVGSWIVGKLRL